jgi:ribosomal-protein-alanine N-acetyltransferase
MVEPTLQLARTRDAVPIASMSRRFVENGLPPAWTPERVARSIRHRDSTVLTARFGRELAGFAIMQYGDSTAHLNLLAVGPGHRRQGIGRRMMAWLEDAALIAGTFVVSLELRAHNEAAAYFYQALGYRRTGWLRGYYQGIEDAVRMERDLRVTTAALE